jgi:hypothetical protein
LETLSNFEKLSLLLEKSPEDRIVEHTRARAMHLLYPDPNNLNVSADFGQFMENLAKSGKIRQCQALVKASEPSDRNPFEDRVIKNQMDLMKLALRVCYACPSLKEWAPMRGIVTVCWMLLS